MSVLLQQTQFEKALHEIYGGKVTCLENFTTPKAILRFVCEDCHTRFYGKCSNIIGNNLGHRHKCFCNYTDASGQRKASRHNYHFTDKRIEEVTSLYNELKDIYAVADKSNFNSYYVHLILSNFDSVSYN